MSCDYISCRDDFVAPPLPRKFCNIRVDVKVCPAGEGPDFTGDKIPTQFGIDTATGTVFANAGEYCSFSVDEANGIAYNALSKWVQAGIDSGDLACEVVVCPPPSTFPLIPTPAEVPEWAQPYSNMNPVLHVPTGNLWFGNYNNGICFAMNTETTDIAGVVDFENNPPGDGIAYLTLDTKNDQIVSGGGGGGHPYFIFINPYDFTYTYVDFFPVPIGGSGYNANGIIYDSKRGIIFIFDCKPTGGPGGIDYWAIDCATHTIISSGNLGPSRGGNVEYCPITDCYFFMYIDDPELKKIDPDTFVVTGTGFNPPGFAQQLQWDINWNMMLSTMGPVDDGIPYAFDPTDFSLIGPATGAAIDGGIAQHGWIAYAYNPCDKLLYVAYGAGYLRFNSDDLSEVEGFFYPGDINAFCYDGVHNQMWSVPFQYFPDECTNSAFSYIQAITLPFPTTGYSGTNTIWSNTGGYFGCDDPPRFVLSGRQIQINQTTINGFYFNSSPCNFWYQADDGDIQIHLLAEMECDTSSPHDSNLAIYLTQAPDAYWTVTPTVPVLTAIQSGPNVVITIPSNSLFCNNQTLFTFNGVGGLGSNEGPDPSQYNDPNFVDVFPTTTVTIPGTLSGPYVGGGTIEIGNSSPYAPASSPLLANVNGAQSLDRTITFHAKGGTFYSLEAQANVFGGDLVNPSSIIGTVTLL